MLELMEKVNKGEATNRNIKDMMRLLAIDLIDTKKLINKNVLISRKKEKLFDKLFDLTSKEYQKFWFALTNGEYKKGNAQLINSSNIGKAKSILKQIMEAKNKKKENNNDKTIREIINRKKNLEKAIEDLDDKFHRFESDISSDEDSLESSIDESSSDNDNDEISKKYEKDKEKEKEKEEKKEEMERELKEKERELKEKEEKMKKFMEQEDEIGIFN